MDKLKLIIWDLDETLYHGTLLEGSAKKNDEVISLIKEAAEHGIISSVCSKNDFNKAESYLNELEINYYLVFKSINYDPKGNRIKNLIKSMNLKEENALFIDDNVSNLNEAKYYCPKLECLEPNEAIPLIKEFIKKSPLDISLKRLQDYKVLEKRRTEEQKYQSNEEFLFKSNIKVKVCNNSLEKIDRICEMINRTNQLNFTKKRFSKEELINLINNPLYESGYITVRDNFGDYGIVGFFLMEGNNLVEFAFSCRILGMRIEQFIYNKLGSPNIEVKGETAVILEKNEDIAWIKEDLEENEKKTLLMYGGCPLRPISIYIKNFIQDAVFYDFEPDPSVLNLANIKRYDCMTLSKIALESNLDENVFDKKIFDYRYILISLSDELRYFKYSNSKYHFYLENKDLENFKKERITPEMIKSELSYLLQRIDNTKLIILLSSEIVFSNHGKDRDYLDRINVNNIARELLEVFPNKLFLLDLNKYASRESDYFNSWGNHYMREIGYKLSLEIKNICQINTISKLDFVVENIDGVEVKSNIINGFFVANTVNDVDLVLLRNNIPIEKSNQIINYQIKEYGCYQIEVNGRKYHPFIYDEYSHYSYYQDDDNKNYYLTTLKQRSKDDLLIKDTINQIIDALLNLTSSNINISDVLIENNVTKLSLFVDENINRIIMPFLKLDKRIKINKIYLDSGKAGDILHFSDTPIFYSELNEIDEATDNEAVLFCYFGKKKNIYLDNLKKLGYKIIYLPSLLEKEVTKLFVKKIREENIPLSLVVKLPNLHLFRSDTKDFYTSNERHIFSQNNEMKNYEKMYSNSLILLKDFSDGNINIKNGYRVTKNEHKTLNKIYLFGSPFLLSPLLDDDNTIASRLSKKIKSEVVNAGNISSEKDYKFAINNLFKCKYNDGDKVILFLSNSLPEDIIDRNYYLSYSELKKYFSHFDATEYLKENNRKDAFISIDSYSADFVEYITENIKVF